MKLTLIDFLLCLQANFFVQNQITFNARLGKASTINTVFQILLQPKSNEPFEYVWRPAGSFPDVTSNLSEAIPFLVNGTAPCCINLNDRLQQAINQACSASNPKTQGWKRLAANITGQLMGSCKVSLADSAQGSSGPAVVTQARFTYAQNPYNLTQEEILGSNGPLVLMIQGKESSSMETIPLQHASNGETSLVTGCSWVNAIVKLLPNVAARTK